MKKLFYSLIFTSIFTFGISACGGEEIDACIGVADNSIDPVTACSDCCESNGYKRGTTSTSGSNTTCKCSGDPD